MRPPPKPNSCSTWADEIFGKHRVSTAGEMNMTHSVREPCFPVCGPGSAEPGKLLSVEDWAEDADQGDRPGIGYLIETERLRILVGR